MDTTRKPASAATASANRAVGARLPTNDDDFADASRGRIAPLTAPAISERFGHAVWDPADWAFIDGSAPASVNPSLWRQAKLNVIHGLFEVAPGVYQVRGSDISNITFIEGAEGWIVIDPLTATETAAAALALLHQHRPARPVSAVIYTHSHVDHFGGVRGVISDEDVSSGRVPVLAPVGFLEAAISENVIAGPAMLRRASYMYGRLLPGDEFGHVDCGLGKAVPLLGTSGLIAPTVEITKTGEEHVLDGVRLQFQYTPDTEAPAEMNIFLPDHRLLCMAENCSATLHNVYTPRGAQIRDSLAWSKYINESIELYAEGTDIVFMSHHWPRFGNDALRTFLAAQRDAYRWLHDQTMRLANHGYTPLEIAEMLEPSPDLNPTFHTRGYYGTMNHNVKAVYQRYLGWFDGNPSHLHELPPVESAERYVAFMGGATDVLRKVAASVEAGEYRWAAQVLNHLVFADPDNVEARTLLADVLEQLGYQSESGPWRDFYLTGAHELRFGPTRIGGSMATTVDVLRAMTVEMIVDLLAVRLDGPRAVGRRLVINLTVLDRDVTGIVELVNGTLHFTPNRHDNSADAHVEIEHLDLARLASGQVKRSELGPTCVITGRVDALDELLGLLDAFDSSFAIVTP